MTLIDDFRVDIGDDDGTIPSGVGTHELLSVSHSNTVVGEPSPGDIIIGNTSSQWDATPSGAEGTFIGIVGGTFGYTSGVPGPQGDTGPTGPSGIQTLTQTLDIENIANQQIVWLSSLGDIQHLKGPSDEIFKIASASGQNLELYSGDTLRIILSPTGTQIFNTVDINAGAHAGGDGTLRAGTIEVGSGGIITTGSGSFDGIQYNINPDIPTHTEGLTYWNNDDKTLNLMTEINGTIIQVGQEMVLRATNKTGAQLDNGEVVYINGAIGNRPTVQKAIASAGNVSSDITLGIVTEDIINNDIGYVTVFGQVRDIDTSAFTAGDQLWLSPAISGAVTNIEPASPLHSVSLGIVNRSHSSQGIIQLRVQNGLELEDLHNVNVSGVVGGNTLVYNESSGLWLKNNTLNVTPAGHVVVKDSGGETAFDISNSGVFSFKTADTPTAVSGIASLYVKSNNNLYMQNPTGSEHVIHGFPLYKSETVGTQGLGAGSDVFAFGFYEFNTSDANLNQGSTTVAFGDSNVSHDGHAFVVCGGVGSVDTGVVGLRVTGTSITDAGVRTTSDSETIITDITDAGQVALNTYIEGKKWLGTVTFELFTISGSPVTYSFDFNYGLSAYEDFANNNFTVDNILAIGLAGASDTNINIELIHHRSSNWVYATSGFNAVQSANVITSLVEDHGIDDQTTSNKHFRWKRTGLSRQIIGDDGEGIIVLFTTSANNAVEYGNIHLGVTF